MKINSSEFENKLVVIVGGRGLIGNELVKDYSYITSTELNIDGGYTSI